MKKNTGSSRPATSSFSRAGGATVIAVPFPLGKACMEDPLNGVCEGWPAPGPEAIFYLGKKGIRCVGTDAPTLGGAEPRRALMTYWALGGNGMAGVEYLTRGRPDSPSCLFLIRSRQDPRRSRRTAGGHADFVASRLSPGVRGGGHPRLRGPLFLGQSKIDCNALQNFSSSQGIAGAAALEPCLGSGQSTADSTAVGIAEYPTRMDSSTSPASSLDRS